MIIVYLNRRARYSDPIMWLRYNHHGKVYETSPSLDKFLGYDMNVAKEWCDRRFHRQWIGFDKYRWLVNPEQHLGPKVDGAPYETPAQFCASNLNPWPERRKDYYYGP